MYDYHQICKILEMTSYNNQISLIIQEKQEQIDHLIQEVNLLKEYHDQLITEYRNKQ